ncbi:endonuclease/exonuclease/phosphatase family protein [Verrucomicrobiaceae bacterium N1E253]|uniref:Endonuclease/exonuclease/phosphatase family protein n=1 Tax=Oceaniferula marina TaxID=2748318 RepID=A0A851GPD9_9BACT|nr:endonuclease/exonuclease/phosphatase family protein [Oceaniferula marina]NWK56887.1 endonuclease/exonuclease/phosphatase family protein [Oceaniferula marina]
MITAIHRLCAWGSNAVSVLVVLVVSMVPGLVQAETKESGGLQLLSFNVRYQTDADGGTRHWKKRFPLAVELVHRMSPDVMGVQEALSGQLDDLQKKLPDYAVFGVGRDDGKRRGEHVSVFYRKDRFRIDKEDCGHFWLSDTPQDPGSRSWGNGITRMCTWLRLVDQRSGRGLYVFNTHWDHRHQGSREQAARLIARRMASRKSPQDPVVLMGDFNVVEKNPAIRYLLGESVPLDGGRGPEKWASPLVDVFQQLHPDCKNRRTYHGWAGQREGMAKIDHVFVSRELKPLAAEICYDEREGVYPSDHYPVSVRVAWP